MDISFFYSEDAPYVQIYSLQHLIYLLVCALVVFLIISYRNWVKEKHEEICKIILYVLLFQQIFLLYGWYALATGFDLTDSLPFHISRITSLLTIAFLLTRKMYFMDIVCYFSIFALISLIYPLRVYHFFHVSGLSYMINHMITIVVPILAIIVYNWRPTWRSYRNAVIGFSIYFPLALISNALTGTGNYFYQTNRPFLHDMHNGLFAVLSFIATLSGFAVVPLVYFSIVKFIQIKNKRMRS